MSKPTLDKNEKIHKYVAEHSMASAAPAIVTRFEWALEQLGVLEEELNRRGKVSPAFGEDMDYGCPHCKDVLGECDQGCVYMKAVEKHDPDNDFDRDHLPCLDVQFEGVKASDVCFSLIQVNLSSDWISVTVRNDAYNHTKEELRKDLESCKAFCHGHIAWAKKWAWGRYRRQK